MFNLHKSSLGFNFQFGMRETKKMEWKENELALEVGRHEHGNIKVLFSVFIFLLVLFAFGISLESFAVMRVNRCWSWFNVFIFRCYLLFLGNCSFRISVDCIGKRVFNSIMQYLIIINLFFFMCELNHIYGFPEIWWFHWFLYCWAHWMEPPWQQNTKKKNNFSHFNLMVILLSAHRSIDFIYDRTLIKTQFNDWEIVMKMNSLFPIGNMVCFMEDAYFFFRVLEVQHHPNKFRRSFRFQTGKFTSFFSEWFFGNSSSFIIGCYSFLFVRHSFHSKWNWKESN